MSELTNGFFCREFDTFLGCGAMSEIQRRPACLRAQAALRSLANKFHRVGECGKIKAPKRRAKGGSEA
jgi:hypothetical protein